MFSDNPAEFFPYTQVEIVHFPNGEAESFTEYPKITGPIPYLINRTLDVLRTSFLHEKVIKQPDKAESIGIWNFRTIPNKPTSSNQQYLTTQKGRLILELLKHKEKNK